MNNPDLSNEPHAIKVRMPDWIVPMLATLTDKYFSDADWLFERKLDGVRCLIFCEQGNVRIMSRNKNLLNDSYPELVSALRSNEVNLIADGEIVTFDGKISSFAQLQKRMHVREPTRALIAGTPVFLYLFDILYLQGYSLTNLALRRRKTLLKDAVDFKDPLRYCTHRNENGEKFLKEACTSGWEGLIAKRAEAIYQHGRSADWLKFKCSNQQELVIGGYTEPQGSRKGFGALLLGFYKGGRLFYAGKVGTGFTDALLLDLHDKMKKIERKTSPFENKIKGAQSIHWLQPSLVAEIAFTEWTADNKLRHPRFLGLRNDKNAKDVQKEQP